MGLCQQISNIYKIHVPAYVADTTMLVKCFCSLLSASSKHRPLILILDGVDDSIHCCNAELFWWLPPSLPQFTKIILSVTEDKGANQNPCRQGNRVLLLNVTPTRRDCNDNLKMKLLENQRKITSGQQVYVNRSLGSHTSPLQMLLLFKEVKEWKSHQDVDGQPLGENAYQSIEIFFQKLEKKYGYEFMSRMLSYITLSRSGIGEVELVDVLSADDMALTQLYHVHDAVGMLRVPDWLIANILHDLKDCIAYRVVTGCRLLWWTNRLYQKVVAQRYLQSQEIICKLHASMCDYFGGRWANGRAKSISTNQRDNLEPKEQHSKSLSTIVNGLAKIYIDRQLPSQPWSFNGRCMAIPNIRKALDLPYHLKESGKLVNLYNDVLMAVPYYKTLLNTGHINSLIHTVEDAAIILEREDVYLIYDMLKETRCLLIENPNGFEMIMQSKLVPLVFLYPCLSRFAKQIYSKAMKNSFLIIVNSAQFRLTPAKAEFQGSPDVVTILELTTKSQLLLVLQDGGVYTWSRRKKPALVYQLPKDMEVISATLENEGPHLALATSRQSVVLLDCTSWTFLNEIRNTAEEAQLIPHGYHLSQSMLFVCFENSPMVSIYNVQSGDLLKEVPFAQNITYYACVGNGDHIVIGQTDAIFIYDHYFSSEKITLQMDISELGIRDVYMYDSDVYVVNIAGHLRIWSTADPSKPGLSFEHYSNEVCTNVISTECSTKYLLICKSTILDVWETLTLEKSSFRPPQKDKFISCIISQSGEQVIASLENVPSVWVWSILSGQCISVIDIQLGAVTQFTKSLRLNVLGAKTQSNCVLLWDLEAIASPTAYSKTGRPVRSILCCEGGYAYTSDGSDVVCQWAIPSSKMKALFKHRDPVEIISVTSSGEFLITSVTSELYVWETDTGLNRHCIQCNSVSQLLIVPNSNFVVTLCKDGVSRVWKPKTGTTVCKIHTPLSQALVTDEGTFLVGLNDRRLLAISLWSGYVSKEFNSTLDPGVIVAFRCLHSNPDFIVLMTSSAEIYTWNMVEETFCHFSKVSIPLPVLSCFFEVSSDGDIIVITVGGEVNVLRAVDLKHCILHNPTSILYQYLTRGGQYLLYILSNNPLSHCDCDFHGNPTLNLIEVITGRRVAHCHLGKTPCAMTVSDEDGTVYIGFGDGTLGLYSIAGKWKDNKKIGTFLTFKDESKEEAPLVNIHEGKASAEILWNESNSPSSSLDCSGDEETPSDKE